MVKIAIVQGRLSPMVGGRYQHFPIHAWREEFEIASGIGFDGIEWIISDFSNPLMDPKTVTEVKELSQRSGISVTSISLDVLMYNPVFKMPWEDVDWLFKSLLCAVGELGIRRVSIPIEENSGIRSDSDKEAAAKVLSRILARYGKFIPLICLETDLSPQAAQNFLLSPGLENLGLLVDLGNSAANGFNLNDFISLCSPRIYGIHIKDRLRGIGGSCPLGEGDAELSEGLPCSEELPKLADITLQAFRTSDRFVEDATNALKFTRRLLRKSPSIRGS